MFACKDDDAVAVEGIELNQKQLLITEGFSENLLATITPDNADNQKIAWASSKPSIATVSDAGKVTGVSAGTTIISATTADGKKVATCDVKVTPAATTTGLSENYYEVDEYQENGYIEIPFLLEDEMAGDITCTLTAIDGIATNAGENWDYKLPSTEVKVEKGSKEGKIIVNIQDSKATKEDRSFKLRLLTVRSNNQLETITFNEMKRECEIVIKKVIREATFFKSLITASTQTSPIDFSLCLTAPVSQDVTLTFQAKDGGTAVEGNHYRLASHKITILAGETRASTQLEILKNENTTCEFEIIEVTGNVDVAMDANCRLEIHKLP